MISVCCEIDGTHAVVFWNDLFHAERVDRIPLALRWRQQSDELKELTQWQHLTMGVDSHCVIDPPSKIHATELQYSKDDGATWYDARFVGIHAELPVVRVKLGDVPEMDDDLALVFATDQGPVTLHTDQILSLSSGAQFTLPMRMSPVMGFFLRPYLWEFIRSSQQFEIECVSPPRFYPIDGSAIVSKAYEPALFAAHVIQDAVTDVVAAS